MCQSHLGDDRRALALELGVRRVARPGLVVALGADVLLAAEVGPA